MTEEPMREERLVAIREHMRCSAHNCGNESAYVCIGSPIAIGPLYYCEDHAPPGCERIPTVVRTDRARLLFEVDRLRTQEQQMRTEYERLANDYDMTEKALRHTQRLVGRMRAENAAMREIVRQVAKGPLSYDNDEWYCVHCQKTYDDEGRAISHADYCPVTKARAIVAQWDTHEEPSDPAR